MAISFTLDAVKRDDMGKGASRRLRREDKVPAVIYGGGEAAASITLEHNKVIQALENEAFYSHILTINVDGKPQQVILKDLQRHPFKPKIAHMDFLRVKAGEELHTKVPVHFINEATCPGVKAGGVVHHDVNELEIYVLPKDLPEFIEVDLAGLKVGDSVHLSQIKLPAGVKSAALQRGDDLSLVSINPPIKSEAAPAAAEGEGEKAE
ncbi:50S ribosomal protein L25/general stress protein Ctc [Permianibacter aggregans]|uniref:Large ribosomal subunit protein bL25 n=1 Tax=Permianibacter aggregans TaxID=1510150 RepID=A0A4R6URR7_9GAMM|nr:50S ribosomal protein L25/general stress protein Ctc [Permianibacter aggregans]QGX40730.1 50S ribosomal protein L25/general stress protein Ctc [Permianibacter aggregans]TDQ48459.1 LSU ribosomal protein L25P [Permianibacter aggregans]